MENARRHWLWVLLGAGVTYFLIGRIFPGLAAANWDTRIYWRLAAWTISAVIFAWHTRIERIKFGSTAARAALHSALAGGLGAFLILVVQFCGSYQVNSAPLHLRLAALVVFPLILMALAFVVAWVLASTVWKPRDCPPPSA